MTSPTPMMAQWQTCKTQAKDALLFFRLGDFYEAFHDDAKLIAKELSLTLTQRQNVPMCGVPYHAAEQYVDKLIARGYKVAIAEQTEDPQSVKGLVKREISRISTPGTIVNSQLLNEKKNNFIASVSQLGSIFGLAVLDLTTGEFRAQELELEQELVDELHRLRPSEFIAARKFKEERAQFFQDLSFAFSFLLNERDAGQFDPQSALTALLTHFQVATLDGFGLKGQSAAITAAGALITYLKDDLSLRLHQVTSIQNEALSHYMALDRSTVRNLELTESLSDATSASTLLAILDRTATPMGARLLRQWIQYPLLSASAIAARQDAIADFLAHLDSARRLHQHLERVRDLERLIAKIAAKCASPRDLWTLGLSLASLPLIRQELLALPCHCIQSDLANLRDVSAVAHEIQSSLRENPPLRMSDGDLFREGVHPELDRLRGLSQDSMDWIARYQTELREKTGIRTLKVGYTKAFGYYIEVSRAKGEGIPEGFQRSQTLVNAERYVTEELKHYEHKVLSSDERAKALEAELFEALRSKIALESDTIQGIAKALARIDALLSLSLAARDHRFNRPVVDDSDVMEIQNGRHPVIESAIGSSHFIPNDTHLGPHRQMLLLTGPNMAGKSTYIRQVALIAIMAQIGSYVPAESARIGVIDKVFSRIGASDDLARGQSTFMVEMSETANILHNATSRSLIILDEIGRGTSTYDGISIAWSVAEFLLTAANKKAKTLFATHYWELTRLEKEHKAAVNMHVAVQETDSGIVFLRKIVPGGTDRSYGIHVAKLAGLPFAVIRRAEEMLVMLEQMRPAKESVPVPKKKRIEEQMPLFESMIIEELRRINPNQLTPMQALQIIADLQARALSLKGKTA
ncbi:MAG: mutS [Parachlamydiales bacterium]|nr:mutS [Parachlamydiales bacterium]